MSDLNPETFKKLNITSHQEVFTKKVAGFEHGTEPSPPLRYLRKVQKPCYCTAILDEPIRTKSILHEPIFLDINKLRASSEFLMNLQVCDVK